MRKLIVFLTSLYAAGVIVALGLLSDWFRQPLPLAESVVAKPLVISAAAVLALAVCAFWRRNELLTILLVALIGGSTWYIATIHHETFGTWLPSTAPTEVASSGMAELKAHGQLIRYRLELHNPGSAAHREWLVVNRDGKDRQLPLPVFDDARSGYVNAKTPTDWIVLRPTADADVYEVKLGRFLLSQKSFRINLRTGTVTALSAASAG